VVARVVIAATTAIVSDLTVNIIVGVVAAVVVSSLVGRRSTAVTPA
jgi:hypothetical protein